MAKLLLEKRKAVKTLTPEDELHDVFLRRGRCCRNSTSVQRHLGVRARGLRRAVSALQGLQLGGCETSLQPCRSPSHLLQTQRTKNPQLRHLYSLSVMGNLSRHL